MIPQIRLNQDKPWSDVFKAKSTLRKLRVMVDVELLAAETGWCAEQLLTGLLTCEDIEAFRYSDSGPPPSAHQMTLPWGSNATVGWVTVTPQPEPGGPTSHTVTCSDGVTTTNGAIGGDFLYAASLDDRTQAYASLAPDDAVAQRSADALAALAAKAIRADLYITHREYLHRVTWPLAQGVTFCSIDEALAVIGLYLRSQGSFLIAKDPESKSTYNFNKGLWYWVGTRELLPEGWRWYKACVDHSQQGPNDLIYLGGAVFQRVSRVLRARDDLLRAVSQAQDNDIADDTLTALDTCLVYLMGAVDATARVAHAVLGLTSNSFNAGWQRRDWLRSVQSLAPGLAAVVGTGATGKDTLTILRLMRNSVHAEGTHPLAVGQPGRRRETLVGLSGADASEILDAADRLGGRAAWGFREIIPGRLHADPRLLLEKLVPAVVELLNMIMAATPVEALSGVSLKPEDLVPPTGAGQAFGERERNSIRWQLGL